MSYHLFVEHFHVDPQRVSRGQVQEVIEEQFGAQAYQWVDGFDPNPERELKPNSLQFLGYDIKVSEAGYKVSGSYRVTTLFWVLFVVGLLLGFFLSIAIAFTAVVVTTQFEKKVRRAKEAFAREPQSALGPKAEGPLDTLERLYALKEKGVITEEEFEAQKAKLLG